MIWIQLVKKNNKWVPKCEQATIQYTVCCVGGAGLIPDLSPFSKRLPHLLPLSCEAHFPVES